MSLFLPPAENHEQALKKAALQVEPSLQKGTSGNAPEKEPEKQDWGLRLLGNDLGNLLLGHFQVFGNRFSRNYVFVHFKYYFNSYGSKPEIVGLRIFATWMNYRFLQQR